MNLTSGENILYRAVAEVFNVPRHTHKELMNKRASVMLMEKIDKELQVTAETGLLKWCFIPCFQQMFHDTNALPMSLHSNFQMVVDFLAYCHEAKIRVMHGGDDLCQLAVVRGGEKATYKGPKRAETMRHALREALDTDSWNASTLSSDDILRSLNGRNFGVAGKDGGQPNEAGGPIDVILSSMRQWMPMIDDHQDQHVLVDTFLLALKEAGLKVREEG